MKWVLIGVGVLVALAGGVLILGLLRPTSHVASHTAVLAVPSERVWAEIADVLRSPEWVPHVTKVERLPDRDGRPSYRESFDGFEATTVITVSDPPRRLVKEILPGGAFHGSWTWELVPDSAGTRLTITERGTVENPFFRGMMVFHDNTKSARDYAAALARRLGSP
ncbi:MAG: SRPBCC family protein [Gemmatimonadota bacterium]